MSYASIIFIHIGSKSSASSLNRFHKISEDLLALTSHSVIDGILLNSALPDTAFPLLLAIVRLLR